VNVENYLTSDFNVSLLPLLDKIFYINSGIGEVCALISSFQDENGEISNNNFTFTKQAS